MKAGLIGKERARARMSVALVNIAHEERNPRSPRPAYRILGIFSSVDEARAHAAGYTWDVDVHAVSLGEFFVLARTCHLDEAAHRDALLRRHARRVRERREEFETNLLAAQRERQPPAEPAALPAEPAALPADSGDGDAPGNGDAVDSMEESAEEPAEDKACKVLSVLKVPRDMEVKMQNFALVSTIEDRESQQHAVCIHAAFDTEQQAVAHARDVLAKRVLDYHIDTVAMYVWCYLGEAVPDEINEEFRVKELTDYVQRRKAEKTEIQALRLKCQEEQLPVNEILIG